MPWQQSPPTRHENPSLECVKLRLGHMKPQLGWMKSLPGLKNPWIKHKNVSLEHENPLLGCEKLVLGHQTFPAGMRLPSWDGED